MAELKVPGAPYQAYPSATPEGQLPRLSVRTDPAAFGANVAGAVEHLGGTLGSVGNELYGRAIAIKDLQDEGISNEASTKQILQSEQAVNEFQQLEGKNADQSA